MYSTRKTRKCRVNEVTDTLLREGAKKAMLVATTFSSDKFGYMTECHGDDDLTFGSGAALDEVDSVLAENFDVKEANRMHLDDIIALLGGKPGSKGVPTQAANTTGEGRRDIENVLRPSAAQIPERAAGTGLYQSIDRPWRQCAMATVMAGMS